MDRTPARPALIKVMSRKLLHLLLLSLATSAGALRAQVVVLTPSTTTLSPGGGTLTFTTSVTYTTVPAVLAFSTTLPAGWTYLSTSGPSSLNAPPANTSGTLNWFYTPPTPASPASFTFTASYPAGLTGLQPLTTATVTRETVESNTSITTPGPTVTIQGAPNSFTWGGGTGDWTVSTNWTPNGVPNNSGLATYSAQISAGTATIPAGTSIGLNTLFLLGGTVNNLGTLTLKDSASSWTDGLITGAGQLINASGSTLTASGTASHDFNAQTITNQAQLVWSGSGNLRSGAGGAIVNAAGATFLDNSTPSIAGSPARMTSSGFTGNFSFANAGTYQKTGTGETKIEIPFTNTGSINVSAGNLRFDSTFAMNAGVLSVATGATTQIDLGLVINPGAKLIGGGAVLANVTVGGASGSASVISPGNTLGLLTVQGNLTLLSTSVLLIDLAGTNRGTNSDFLSVTGAATLGGNLNLFLGQGVPVLTAGATQFTVLTAASLAGAFANAPTGTRLTTVGNDGSFLVNYVGNSVVLSNFVPIPEPSSYALLAAGLAVVALAARRRRR